MISLSLSAPEQELQRTLKELRLSIIGDEDEKLELLHSTNLNVIFSLIDGDDSKNIEQLLIILYSLSLLPEALPKLINQFNLFTVLVRVANKYHEHESILVNVFHILANVLSMRGDFNLDLSSSSDGMLFNNLLYHKLTASTTDTKQTRLLTSIFGLIPHLNPNEMKGLISPILKILESVLKLPLSHMARPKKLFNECFDEVYVPTPPKLIFFPSYTAHLLFAISHLLYQDTDTTLPSPQNQPPKNVKIDSVLSQSHYYIITSLLKSPDPELKLSAITVIINYSLYSDLSESQKNANVKKVLPFLIQLIEFEDVDEDAPIKVYNSDLHLSRNFNPLYILSKLALNFEFVNNFLLNCDIISKICDVVVKFGKKSKSQYKAMEMNNISYCFLILSSVTAQEEQNRKDILSKELAATIEKVLEYHLSMLTSESEVDVMALTTSNQLAISACTLLRSLSRSIFILRSHCADLDITKSLMEIVSYDDSQLDECCQQNEVILKTVVLAIISNFALDFSPLRKTLLSGGLVEVLAQLLTTSTNRNILLTSLWVLRHIVYNEESGADNDAVKKIGGLEKIIGFCNHEDPEIQEMAFNVLRNLTTKSKDRVAQLLGFFGGDDDQAFLKFICNKLQEYPMYQKQNYPMLEALMYIVVHIAANDEASRDLVVRNDELLVYIRELLLHCQSIQVKLACIWTIINLSWQENTQRSGEGGFMNIEDNSDVRNAPEVRSRLRDLGRVRRQNVVNSLVQQQGDQDPATSVNRVAKLTEMGFPQILTEIRTTVDNLDIRERCKTALGSLGAHSGFLSA